MKRLGLALAILASAAYGTARRGAAQDTTPASQPPAFGRLDRPGLPNLAKVDPGVYRGGRPDLDSSKGPSGIDSLKGLGVVRVIDLQGGDLHPAAAEHVPDWAGIVARLEPGETQAMIEKETAAGAAAGIEVLSLPLDSLDEVDAAEARRIAAILNILVQADAAHPVYVHCEHGKDRTGLVMALYRIRYDGWSELDAAREMAAMGHTGRLDEYFTGHMDLSKVLADFPFLGSPQTQSP